jgi:hypothetical protein
VQGQVHGTPALLDAKRSWFSFILQVVSMMQNSENPERKKEQQRNHLQLIDMIAILREEVRKLHSIPSEASQSREQLLLVSLVWLYCVDAWDLKHGSRKSSMPIDNLDRELYLRWCHPHVPKQQIVSVLRPCRELLPTALQMIDSGEISRVSEDVVIEGSQLLFYTGEWISDGERVRSLFDVRSKTDLS